MFGAILFAAYVPLLMATVVILGAFSGKKIKIYVVTPSGDKIYCEPIMNDKVRDFKRTIMENTGIDPSQQRLTLNGQELKNDHKLKDYGIDDKSIIHLHLHLAD